MLATSLSNDLRRFLKRMSAEHLSALPDEVLLSRFREERDPAALEAIVGRHGSLVLAVLRRHLDTANDIEDAFQATWLVLLRKAGTIRGHAALGSWLHGVARRVAATARTTDQRRQRREQAIASPEADEPSSDLCRQEAVLALQEELTALPGRYRRALGLSYWEGKTREEAAAVLGCSPATVKGLLERARRILRQRLTRRGICLSAGLFAAAETVSALPLRFRHLAALAGDTPRPTALALAQKVLAHPVGWLPWSLAGCGLLFFMVVGLWSSASPGIAQPVSAPTSLPTPNVAWDEPQTPAALAAQAAERNGAALRAINSYYAEMKLETIHDGKSSTRSAKYSRNGDKIRLTEQFSPTGVREIEANPSRLYCYTVDSAHPPQPNVTQVLIAPPHHRVVDTDPWEHSLFTLPIGIYAEPPKPIYTLTEALRTGELRSPVWEDQGRLMHLRIDLPKEKRSYEVWVAPARNWLAVESRHTIFAADGSPEWRLENRVLTWSEVQPGQFVPTRTQQRSWFRGQPASEQTATLHNLKVKDGLPPMPKMPLPPAGTLVMDRLQMLVYPLDDKGQPTEPKRRVTGTYVPGKDDDPTKRPPEPEQP